MQKEDLIKLVDKILKIRCETQNIEVKSANKGCPTKLYDTLSSFSNQDSGGVIVFGIDEKDNFKLVGVYDAQDLQHKVNEQCKQMEPQIRALFTIAQLQENTVISAEIPSADISDRPVFYKGAGRSKGSYIRVGDADEHMNEYEIYSYEAFKKQIKDDIRIVPDFKMSLLDNSLIEKYLTNLKRERANLSENLTDDEILEVAGIIKNNNPTLAGVMCFSKYPQGYFPQLCITAVSLPGTEMGDTNNNEERFIDNKRIMGNIIEMLEDALAFVRKNSRTKTIIDDSGRRNDKDEYPMKAVREAILNALVHRDYSIHTENIPIRIEMYRDRMEIINSGGLYGRVSIDSLGNVRPETRNPVIANILESLKITENRYSGIPTIRKEFKKANLPEPVFKLQRGDFKVIFKNDLFKDNISGSDLKLKLLEFCKTPRTRDELIKFTGFSRTHTMNNIVKSLIEENLIKLTIPEKNRSRNQKYVSV